MSNFEAYEKAAFLADQEKQQHPYHHQTHSAGSLQFATPPMSVYGNASAHIARSSYAPSMRSPYFAAPHAVSPAYGSSVYNLAQSEMGVLPVGAGTRASTPSLFNLMADVPLDSVNPSSMPTDEELRLATQ